MSRLTGLLTAVLLATVLVLPGCKTKSSEAEDRCNKMADKAFEMAGEMAKAMAKMLPPDKVKEMEAEMEANMKKERPKIVTGCQEALVKDPALIPIVDCAIAAKDMAAAAACDPEGKLKALNSKPAE